MKKSNVLSILKRISVIFIMVGIMFLSMGFYKKMAYSNPDKAYTTSDDYINSYVGGDALIILSMVTRIINIPGSSYHYSKMP